MRILGFIETSFLDWDNKLSAVIFVGGCNFKCPFCHNHELARDLKRLKELDFDNIKKKLVAKKAWLDGVVISGGEPMMHPEIFGLLIELKKLNYKTKIDTNGSFPYPLKEAIELGLVDYVAMDIKTTFDKRYDKAIGREAWLEVLLRTVRLLKESGVDYEFRTTMVPTIVAPTDLITILKDIAPVKKYAIQQFVPKNARLKQYRLKKPYTKEEILKVLPELKPYAQEVVLRGF
ncbi:MAG: anaerobic ribonucleoside-triphosphate reductase activating protein [candidate division WOR-3 bacterium]|nr:anaerobic ribonucleoside-triphosphate reductase activating protein [candidate division WOR-3 bacterium]MCX7757646.1 anaerobic ribonucleoside-triphosphate reductase activating protein [candidate division WOR-3 bacterium]MDW7987446.1 anaerobic ribonucleoside-triphosphate reductase activating protein [candidate division WOR-3 bacterium]